MSEEEVEMEETGEKEKTMNATQMMKKVHPEYRKHGISIYGCLVLCFLVFAILYIVFKAKEREDPPISVDFEQQSYAIPSFYFCPTNVVSYKSAYCDVPDEFGEESDCDFEIVNDEDSVCIEFEYTESTLLEVPAEIQLEVLYTGTLSGFLEIEMSFGEDLTRIYYIGVGERNTEYGLVTNVIVERLEKKYLDEEQNANEWSATISPTPALYVETDDDHEDVTCASDVNASMCSAAAIADCPDGRTEDGECAFLMIVYLQFQSRTVEIIKQTDPLNFGEVAGVLGGYWVYVGAIFGLCFAADSNKKDRRLYPSKVAKKTCCIK